MNIWTHGNFHTSVCSLIAHSSWGGCQNKHYMGSVPDPFRWKSCYVRPATSRAQCWYERSLERRQHKLHGDWFIANYLNYRLWQTLEQTTYRRYAGWPKSLQVRAVHKLCSRDSAQDLDVKLSPCMCSHSSFDWQQSQTVLLFMVCMPCVNQHNVLLAQGHPTMLKHLSN